MERGEIMNALEEADRILEMLASREMSEEEIYENTALSRETAQILIEFLASVGLVTKEGVCIKLTDSGRKFLEL